MWVVFFRGAGRGVQPCDKCQTLHCFVVKLNFSSFFYFDWIWEFHSHCVFHWNRVYHLKKKKLSIIFFFFFFFFCFSLFFQYRRAEIKHRHFFCFELELTEHCSSGFSLCCLLLTVCRFFLKAALFLLFKTACIRTFHALKLIVFKLQVWTRSRLLPGWKSISHRSQWHGLWTTVLQQSAKQQAPVLHQWQMGVSTEVDFIFSTTWCSTLHLVGWVGG